MSFLQAKSYVLVAAVCAVLAAAAVRAQPAAAPTEPPFSEEQRITVVDTMVEVVSRKGRPAKLPSYLRPEDFEVLYQDAPRRVVGVSAFGPAQAAPDTEPWRFVIYFDHRLSSPTETSWAAGELVEVSARLAELGSVEVLIADPAPKTALEPTRDAELLASVLAELALFPEGDDHGVLALRDEFLAEIAEPDSRIDPVELASFAVSEEALLVGRQLDGLATCMSSSAAGGRRVLLLVQGGFDLHPEEFYRSHLGRGSKELETTEHLERIVADLERTLAAYGWSTWILVPPVEEQRAGGLRLGKWRLGAPRLTTRETAIDPTHPSDTVGPVMLDLLRLTRSGERDPKKAAAFLEFAETLAAQGDYSEAEQAFRMTLFHLDDDPAAAHLQAGVLVKLGKVLEAQGRPREARAVFEAARELDPESVVLAEVRFGELLAGLDPLERLASASAGGVLRGGESLTQALAALSYRVRVSYQVSGSADGSVHPVEVRCLRRGCQLRAPAWARSGTPDEVAAARLRRWLADDELEGDLKTAARLVADPRPGVVVEIEAPTGVTGEGTWRLTLGYGDPESIVTIRHSRPPARRIEDPARWTFTSELDRDLLGAAGTKAVAVLVEHLESGRWGASVVELP